MLKGHTYDEQIYDSYAHRMLNRAFMDNKSGIVSDQGNACEVSYTARNIIVSDGYIIVQGGITEISSEETLEVELDDSYCRLVYEVDMTKTNDDTSFNQGALKVLKSSSDYPILTQNTLTKNTGIYQFELAQFRASISGISNFIDKRSYIDYGDTLDWLKDGLGVSEDTYSTLNTYGIGDKIIHNNKIYKCIEEILTPENFDPTKWQLVPIISSNCDINSDILGTVLFENPNGTTGNVVLMDNYTNYKYLEIYGYENTTKSQLYTKYDTNSGKNINLNSLNVTENGILMRFISTNYEISNTVISPKLANSGIVHIYGRNINAQQQENAVLITKVVGIK